MTSPGTARTTRFDRSRVSTRRRGKRTERRAIGTAASVASDARGGRVAERVERGVGQGGRRRQGAAPTLHDQVDDGPDRHAERQHDQEADAGQRHGPQSAQRQRSQLPGGARAQPRRPAVSPHGVLAGQQQRTEEHQDEGEGAGRRLVEPDLELVVDLRRQRLVAQDLEGAELGQHDQPDQDGSAEDGQTGLAHRDRPERAHPAQSEAARHLLLGRVRAPQAGGHREEDQGIDGQGHHQHGGPEPADGGEDGAPSEAHHEIRDAERDHDEDGEETAAGHVRPLDEPGGQGADDGAQRGDDDDQADRVPDQCRGETSEQELVQLRPPDLDGLDDEEHEGQQDGDRHQDGSGGEEGWQPAPAAAATVGREAHRHSSWASCSSLIASAPVPRSAMVMLFGCSWSNGVSGSAVVTPDAMGYS